VLVMTAGRDLVVHGRPVFRKPLHVDSLLRAVETCLGPRSARTA
jgi:hypothetical protein